MINAPETRLNKYIASAGVCSRRAADKLIKEGKVTVNGNTVCELAIYINEYDIVALDGKVLTKKSGMVYIILNKPTGCVTTVRDQFNRKTVLDYVKHKGIRLFPVGRLDYNTTGLLIITNDGDYAAKVTHPANRIEKTYAVTLKEPPPKNALDALSRGVRISDKNTTINTSPAKITKTDNTNIIHIKIHEGRNRQIRKMCEAVGLTITALSRIRIGGLFLGDLKPGQTRVISREEAEKVFK